MKACIDIIFEVIICYSTTKAEFKTMPVVRQSTLKFAKKMSDSNFKLLNKRNKRVVEYRGSKSKHTLTFDDKYHAGYCCTCAYFVKQAVCSHIVGYDLLNQLGIFNLRIHKPDNNFVVLNKKYFIKIGYVFLRFLFLIFDFYSKLCVTE